MSSTEIFRCNRCCTQLRIFDDSNDAGRPQRNYLTSCYHVLCERCQAIDHTKCGYCGKNAKFCRITKQMPFNVRVLFEPFEHAHKSVKQVKQFQQCQNRLILQRLFDSHQKLMQGISMIDELEEKQKETNIKMVNQCKKLHALIMEKQKKRHEHRQSPLE